MENPMENPMENQRIQSISHTKSHESHFCVFAADYLGVNTFSWI